MVVFFGLLVCVLGASLMLREAFGASLVSDAGDHSSSDGLPRVLEFLFVASWFAFVIWFTWPLTPILFLAAIEALPSFG